MKTIKKSDQIDLAPWKAKGGEQLPPPPPPGARALQARSRWALGLAPTRDPQAPAHTRRPRRPLPPRLTPCVLRCPWWLGGPAVSVSIKSRIVTVKGPRGELVRNFKHCAIDMQLTDDKLLMDMWFATKKQLSTLGSLKSHITNMMVGVVQVRHQLLACTR